MSNHTPGPWIRSSLGFQVLTRNSEKSICELPSRHNEAEQIADANLIAAAPDLLAACEAARTVVDSQESRAVWALLSNAIAKAKGQTNE